MPVCIFGRAQEAGAVAVVIANHSDLLFNVLGQMRDMKLPGMIYMRAWKRTLKKTRIMLEN